MRFSLPSFAKINWTLRVLGKRDDGFHELFTVFQTVSLYDRLTFSPAQDLSLTCNQPWIPLDGRNLVIKAANALNKAVGGSFGAAIHLKKHIPSSGGLGGGSSNAAVTLIGLRRLWRLHISDERLISIAAEVGSDAPFFLIGGTALGAGRGERLESMDDIVAANMLIVTPRVRVSTRTAFAGLNAPALTSDAPERILSVSRNGADLIDPLRSELTNDFERSVFVAYPEIERVKRALLDLGAANAALSGSGASVFAVFDKQETRQAAEKALASEATWRKFAVSTISRREYREALGI
ncbi:MAG: 4-(cytidine 5'-diphospho)-2-C-methyl-D-erythritol kinase [Chloracidobacterium sp.]|nr:4-(cytidine 5'-diphospho)-2-C-methyl-D-erythritol kinase [Chloracidobacterium sp.]